MIKPKFDFKKYKDFNNFISISNYNPSKILNKYCKITHKEWSYFLEVLPPMLWYNESNLNFFYLSECLTENIYLKFVRIFTKDKKEIYYCCCERINQRRLVKEGYI